MTALPRSQVDGSLQGVDVTAARHAYERLLKALMERNKCSVFGSYFEFF
jgi:hypothetical protein